MSGSSYLLCEQLRIDAKCPMKTEGEGKDS